MEVSDGQVTRILHAMRDGDSAAAQQLFPLVYAELHRLAQHYMRRERRDHTLQPTALINEAFLRLAPEAIDWQDRQHFIAIAATTMRRVLVDHARAHHAQQRGGNLQRVELEDAQVAIEDRTFEVLAVDQALTRLQEQNPRQARIIELRYFAGLTLEEVAVLLGIAERTVKRDWALARIWLLREMGGPPSSLS
ncbi:sigma-70 family RNA polymerase sigma factor [Acidipila sp. EB88]|uniref:sigma-70 family RNA polymerase sigma factor n=1 Tax=Acidipila sp. EB88 TaxID=2305226 RepID=UPI000F5E9FFF|nr:sigma-70 family RNA polymerase sigma factor [Acidipila sp. EB88]RRA47560.1 sigma-70 family RNA polymerase sigma factor [Acidipila sp. EB88]